MTNGAIFCSQCGRHNSATAQFCSNCGAALAASVASSLSGATFATTTPSPYIATGPSALVHSQSSGYGGFWVRFIAAIIDGIVVQAVVMPVAFVVGLVIGVAGAALNSGQGPNMAAIAIGGVFGLFASWLYEAFMESSARQATLGKMALGMRVTDLQGNRISFAQATARHFCKYISAMILMIGYIIAGFTERKQALHDMIAGTLVRRH
jgi:uncharacterized RDD family membrane protein YckC